MGQSWVDGSWKAFGVLELSGVAGSSWNSTKKPWVCRSPVWQILRERHCRLPSSSVFCTHHDWIQLLKAFQVSEDWFIRCAQHIVGKGVRKGMGRVYVNLRKGTAVFE